MARKFKKKLAPKIKREKTKPVLSVELVRKETLQKLTVFWKGIVSKVRTFKLAN